MSADHIIEAMTETARLCGKDVPLNIALRGIVARAKRYAARDEAQATLNVCNHLYEEIPKLGSVALCGHVKNNTKEASEGARMCPRCVESLRNRDTGEQTP